MNRVRMPNPMPIAPIISNETLHPMLRIMMVDKDERAPPKNMPKLNIALAVPRLSGGKRSEMIEYADGLKTDSKIPRHNLRTKSIAKLSITPIKKVIELHKIQAQDKIIFLLARSDIMPPKMPKSEKDIVKAAPAKRP